MNKPSIPQVIDRFEVYHEKNPSWGSLHIVLDDHNTQDDHVRHCIEWAEQKGDHEGAELARILLTMSKTQRAKLPKLIREKQRANR